MNTTTTPTTNLAIWMAAWEDAAASVEWLQGIIADPATKVRARRIANEDLNYWMGRKAYLTAAIANGEAEVTA